MKRGLFVLLILLVAVGSSGMRASVVVDTRAEKCKVHGEKLREDSVPIIYGMPIYDPKYGEARGKYFPNGNSKVAGGCEVWKGMPEKVQVRYCQKCRDAEVKWLKKQRGKTADNLSR